MHETLSNLTLMFSRYYGVSTFVIANSLASAPFLFLISIISSCVVYWLANLNDQGDR